MMLGIMAKCRLFSTCFEADEEEGSMFERCQCQIALDAITAEIIGALRSSHQAGDPTLMQI